MGKPTLVFDLIEEFRQPVVDKVIIGMIKKNEKFTMDGNELSLETRKRLVEAIQNKLDNKIKFRGQVLSLREIIRNQANAIAKYLEGKAKYKPFVDKW